LIPLDPILLIRLFQSITLSPPKPLQISQISATLIYMTVHSHVSFDALTAVGVVPCADPPRIRRNPKNRCRLSHSSFYNYKFCSDVEVRTPMNKKTQPLTTAEVLTMAQQLTGTHYFPGVELEPASSSSEERSELKRMLKEHRTEVDELSVPFSIYKNNLAQATPRDVRWLWEKRLPLAGMTLLDGDHGCGKTLLALQLAAHVSSGSRLPDGTTTIPGGVVIVTPYSDANTTQLQLLTALGADLSRIEILSFVPVSAPEFHTGGHRPFSLPEDLPRLFTAIKRVDARLVIFDPFISLLSRDNRWTNERLSHLLADLNQRLIERNVACLILRNCPAKGGHARPSMLERSDHFSNIATSRLLLAPDPMQPDRLLLSHSLSRHSALTPTLILQIQPMPTNSDIPHITVQGSHSLQARDFIENRPDSLHRRLLSRHLLRLIAAATDPIHVSTLYARSPHSSPFQIQRSLNDLLRMGQIERPARGFYAPATPVSPLNQTGAITPSPISASPLNQTGATTSPPTSTSSLDQTGTTTSPPTSASSLDQTGTTTPLPEPMITVHSLRHVFAP
jgi:hypothetical protein